MEDIGFGGMIGYYPSDSVELGITYDNFKFDSDRYIYSREEEKLIKNVEEVKITSYGLRINKYFRNKVSSFNWRSGLYLLGSYELSEVEFTGNKLEGYGFSYGIGYEFHKNFSLEYLRKEQEVDNSLSKLEISQNIIRLKLSLQI